MTGGSFPVGTGAGCTLTPEEWQGKGPWVLGAGGPRKLLGGPPPPPPRKEVIQPHLPVRLPCYDFVPVTNPTFDGCLLTVGPPASGVIGFHDVTGGVYKARGHIHRRMLTGGD